MRYNNAIVWLFPDSSLSLKSALNQLLPTTRNGLEASSGASAAVGARASVARALDFGSLKPGCPKEEMLNPVESC